MPQRLKWKTDLEKSVVTLNFERRGWQKVTDDDAAPGECDTGGHSTSHTNAFVSYYSYHLILLFIQETHCSTIFYTILLCGLYQVVLICSYPLF